MINLHTVYLVALISQATSTLVLLIFAFLDRRSRWLMPLSAACALHAVALYLMPIWRGTGRWLPQALSAAILVVMFYLIHLGIRGLVNPFARESTRVTATVLGLVLVIFAIGAWHPWWSTRLAWSAAIVFMAWTVRTLWTHRRREPRGPLWATILLLLLILVHFIVRLPMEAMRWAPALVLELRKSTMLLISSLALAFLALYVAESLRRLHDESRTDALTGLPNRRAIEEVALHELRRTRRRARPCALLLLDLDHFKKLNDTWGHHAGDRALVATAAVLLREARDVGGCSVARMGGEEFAMLLSDHSLHAAHVLAERLCAEIAELRVMEGGTEIRFTTSIGVSALEHGETSWIEMLQRADVAMYRAKRAGRNRVALCTEALLRTGGDGTDVDAPADGSEQALVQQHAAEGTHHNVRGTDRRGGRFHAAGDTWQFGSDEQVQPLTRPRPEPASSFGKYRLWRAKPEASQTDDGEADGAS